MKQLRRPRVLFVTHVADRTGAPRIVRYLLHHLGGLVDAELLVLRDGGQLAAFERHAPTWLVGRDPIPDLAAFDVLYANSTGSLPALQQLEMVVPPSVHYLLHVHEIGAGLDGVDPRLGGRLPDTVVACADAVASEVGARWSLPSVVLHEFVDVARTRDGAAATELAAPAAEARADLAAARAQGSMLVGAVGTRWPYKGPDLFWRAARRIERRLDALGRRSLFVWIGGAADEMSDVARRARDEVPASLRLEVDEVDNPLPLVALLDVLLVPGRDDPFPLACLEAAALAVPAAAFDAGGIHELLGRHGGLVVSAFDVDLLARNVVAWLLDHETRQEAGRRLAAAVEADHDVGPAIARVGRLLWAAAGVAAREPVGRR